MRDNDLKTRVKGNSNNKNPAKWRNAVPACWQLSVKLSKSSHNFVNLGPHISAENDRERDKTVTIHQESWNGQHHAKLILCMTTMNCNAMLAIWWFVVALQKQILRFDLRLTVVIAADRHRFLFQPCIHYTMICGYDTIQNPFTFGEQLIVEPFAHFCGLYTLHLVKTNRTLCFESVASFSFVGRHAINKRSLRSRFIRSKIKLDRKAFSGMYLIRVTIFFLRFPWDCVSRLII